MTTWGQLEDAVSRVAEGFGEQGLVAGNRVLIATGNRTEFVVTYLAALRARLVAVPVDPRAATGELVRMVADCRPRLVVADPSTITSARTVVAGVQEALSGAGAELRSRTVVPRVVALDCLPGPGEVEFSSLLAAQPRDPLPARDPEALAALLYTSGTTTQPRAAMLSHRALLANIEQVAALAPAMVGADDVVLGILPLFHVYGLNAVLGQVLRQQATLVVVDGFEPEGTLEAIERYRVTVVPLAPPVLAHWRRVRNLADRLPGVRMVVSGSAPLSPELAKELTARTGLAIHQGYGLTEAGPVVTCTLGRPSVKPGSVGAALPGVSLRLVDETGDTPSGEDPGEIMVSGDNLFDGYWPDASDGPVGGWFGTGDVGFLDADGDLFLVDRLTERLVVSGFNVYPSEIEDVLNDVEGVLESAVVGVPDEESGEAVVAYLSASVSDAEEVRDLGLRAAEACRRQLARFKQPTRIEVVQELPHTVVGNIARGTLRSALRRRHHGILE